MRGRWEGAGTHLSPSGLPHLGHPPAAGRRTLQVSAVWGGSRDSWAGVKQAPGPLPIPSDSSACRAPYLSPQNPQDPKSHTRVGGGSAHSIPKSPAQRWASAYSYGLVSPGLGTRGPAGALRWRVSPRLWGPEAPEVTEPSRLVGESSGGEVRKQQLDTRVRQEPPRGPVSGAEWGGQGAETGLRTRGRPGAARVWVPPRRLAPDASPFVPSGYWNPPVGAPTCPTPGPLHRRGDPVPSAD